MGIGQFIMITHWIEDAWIEEEILKTEIDKFIEKHILECIEQLQGENIDIVVKEWLNNNSKFSLWEWLYNSISLINHQRQYR